MEMGSGGNAGLDTHKAAGSLVKYHGRRAVRIAASRANKLAEEGDRAGALEWLTIAQEALLLLKKADQQ